MAAQNRPAFSLDGGARGRCGRGGQGPGRPRARSRWGTRESTLVSLGLKAYDSESSLSLPPSLSSSSETDGVCAADGRPSDRAGSCSRPGGQRAPASDAGLREEVPHFLVACLVLNTNFEAVNFNEGVLPGPTPPTRFGAPCRWCAISRSSLTCILPF